MKIRISTKLTIGFMTIVLMMVVLSYYSVTTSQKYLQSSIGNESVLLSKEIMRRIDKIIINFLDDVRLQFRHNALVLETIKESNIDFGNIGNVNGYIENTDREWIKAGGEMIPLIQEYYDNNLSHYLRDEFISYYERQNGYKLFTEAFITNKYGAVIALSGITTDYRQSDEDWWKIAKDKGYYISNFEYDECLETYGISIAISLIDEKGNFLGVLKAVVSAEGIVRNADVTPEQYSKSRIHLITNDGKLIFRTTPYVLMEDISHKEYFSMINSESGHFIADTEDGRKLMAYARSKGFNDYQAFNWTIIICQDILDVLGPALLLKSQIYSVAFIILLGTIIVAFITSRFINVSIAKLNEGTKAVGKGDLNHKINIETNDEIGDFADAFNQMTVNLKEVTASRDDLNWEITERKKIEEELRRHHEHLIDMVAERTSDLQKVNEELEQEIADRTKAEKEARHMALFAELNPSPVLRFDIDGKIVIANKSALEILNIDNLIGKPLDEVIPDMEGIDFASCIRNGSIFTHAVLTGDRFFHFIFKGITDMNFGQAYGSDITDRKLAEAEAMRASHLASLGELAAGVAHEINNPINGIINIAQIIVNKSSVDHRDHDLAMRIIKEGDRIADIVKGLLSFARAGKKEKQPVKVSDIIDDTLILTDRLLRKDGIKLDVTLAPDLPLILANPQQIEQVFLNLVSNARYALNHKYPEDNTDKILKIVCDKVSDDNMVFARIVFIDHGTGIPPEIIGKVLNPFFSTKPSDEGTGLGLSISHGIITDHRGKIRFESEEGKYTKVIVELPAVT